MPLLADLLRTELLSRYGGVWADTSLVPIQPLDNWLHTVVAPAGFWGFAESHAHPLDKSLASVSETPMVDCLRLRAHSFGICSVQNTNGKSSIRSQSSEMFGESVGSCTKRLRTKNCKAWIYSDPSLNSQLQGVVNWFLVSAHPHHPLVDAWLAQYERSLWRINPYNKRGHTYFLHGCSLVSLHQLACVRSTLNRMPTFPKGHPGSSATVSEKTDTDHRINPRHYMYKRPTKLKETTYEDYIQGALETARLNLTSQIHWAACGRVGKKICIGGG